MGTPLRVLMVEDSANDAVLLEYELKAGGYDPIPERVETRDALRAALEGGGWELVLADYDLPRFSGVSALRMVKETEPDLPFIVVSGRIGEETAVMMMKAGAHDYIMKNNLARLVPAVERELREAQVRHERRRTREALRKTEALYQRIVETANEGILAIDEKTRITFVNPRMADILGLTVEEMMGQPLEAFIVEDDLADHREQMALRREGKGGRYERKFRRKDGDTCRFLVSATPIQDAEGRFAGSFGMFTDITERKRMEDNLRLSESQLRDAQAMAHVGNWEYDTFGDKPIWSAELFRIFGRDPSLGEPTWLEHRASIHPGDWERVNSAVENAIRQGIPYSLEFRIIHSDGNIGWGWTIGKTMSDAQGKGIKLFGTVQDITERKQAEETFRESESRFRNIIETTGAGYFRIGRDGRFQHVNKAWLDMHGYSSTDQIIGRTFAFTQPETELPQATALVENLLQHETFATGDFARRYRDGSVGYHTFSAVSVVREGKVIGLEGFLIDTTERKKAEDALREKEYFVQSILGTTPNLIYIYDLLEGRNVYANREVLGFLGYTPEKIRELGSALFLTILHPDDAGRVDQHHARFTSARDGEVLELDYRMKHADGQWRWLRSHDVVFARDQEGRVRQILGSAEDITNRWRMEEALRQSEEKFLKAFKYAPVLMTISDITDGTYLDVNDKFEEVSGFCRAEAIGKSSVALGWITPHDRDLLFQVVREKGRISGMELSLCARDGRRVECLYHGELITLGNTPRLLSIAVDITDRKQAEKNLRESEERYRTVADFTYDWEFWIGPDGKFLYISPSAERITAYPPEELLKDPGLHERIVCPDFREAFSRHLREEFESYEVFHFDFPILRRDGGQRWISHYCRPVFSTDGRFLGRRGSNRDITERKESEEQLQKNQAELAHVGRVAAVGEMASSLAHELNQPLCSIQNHAEACAKMLNTGRGEKSEIISALKEITAQAQRAGLIVGQVKNFIRKSKPKRTRADINQIVRNVVRFVTPHLQEDGVRLKLTLGDPLPALVADSVQIEQVVLNLVQNAIDAMAENETGHRVLQIETDLEDSDRVRVQVRDNGKGVSVEDQPHILESFFTTKSNGLGMGLPISRSIIENHGGKFWFQANSDRGMTFCFTLPVTPSF